VQSIQGSLEAKKNRMYLALIAPSLALYILGVILPIAMGFRISLTDWNGFTPTMNYVGLENYRRILSAGRLANSFGFTLSFVLGNTVIQNAAALGFALLISAGLRGRNFIKTVIFVPCLLSPILIGFLWSKLLGTVYPQMLGGKLASISLLTDPKTVLAGLLLINNWQWVGYWMLIYLAALQGVPEELYESARMEGARFWYILGKITVPMIMQAITICVVSITIGGFQVYELIVTATGGGPGFASESIIMYIYNLAFSAEKAAFASANSMVFVVFLAGVSIIQIALLRKREVES